MDLRTQLSESERDELEELLQERDPTHAGVVQALLTRAHGFLTCVLSGPMVMPSERLPAIFRGNDDDAWETLEQAQRATHLLMRFYNEIALGLRNGEVTIVLDCVGDPPDEIELADDWCEGFVAAFSLRAREWSEVLDSKVLDAALMPIMRLGRPDQSRDLDPTDGSGEYAALVDALSNSVLEIAAWWRSKLTPGTFRRGAPKISPNAPCPCGSGKKYKRCCSGLRAI